MRQVHLAHCLRATEDWHWPPGGSVRLAGAPPRRRGARHGWRAMWRRGLGVGAEAAADDIGGLKWWLLPSFPSGVHVGERRRARASLYRGSRVRANGRRRGQRVLPCKLGHSREEKRHRCDRMQPTQQALADGGRACGERLAGLFKADNRICCVLATPRAPDGAVREPSRVLRARCAIAADINDGSLRPLVGGRACASRRRDAIPIRRRPQAHRASPPSLVVGKLVSSKF